MSAANFSRRDVDYCSAKITPRLAYVFAEGDEAFPAELAGATITRIGSPEDPKLIEGGGLVIDFVPQGATTTRRLVLGFTELGMWIEYVGDASISWGPGSDSISNASLDGNK